MSKGHFDKRIEMNGCGEGKKSWKSLKVCFLCMKMKNWVEKTEMVRK